MHTEAKSFAQVTTSVSGRVIADLRCDLKLPYQYLNYYTEIRKHIPHSHGVMNKLFSSKGVPKITSSERGKSEKLND